MDRVLVLEEFCDSEGLHKVYLFACDDGCLNLRLPSGSYPLRYDEIVHISDDSYISLVVFEGSTAELLYQIEDEHYDEVADFLEYWDGYRLKELKDKKVNSFLDFWKFIFKFVEDNVDLEQTKPTFEVAPSDCRDYGGGLSIYFNIDLSWGNSWEDDYNKGRELTEELMSLLIDREFLDDDALRWYGDIFINFNPKAKNKKDFIKF